jgi:hypothetical protein
MSGQTRPFSFTTDVSITSYSPPGTRYTVDRPSPCIAPPQVSRPRMQQLATMSATLRLRCLQYMSTKLRMSCSCVCAMMQWHPDRLAECKKIAGVRHPPRCVTVSSQRRSPHFSKKCPRYISPGGDGFSGGGGSELSGNSKVVLYSNRLPRIVITSQIGRPPQ